MAPSVSSRQPLSHHGQPTPPPPHSAAPPRWVRSPLSPLLVAAGGWPGGSERQVKAFLPPPRRHWHLRTGLCGAVCVPPQGHDTASVPPPTGPCACRPRASGVWRRVRTDTFVSDRAHGRSPLPRGSRQRLCSGPLHPSASCQQLGWSLLENANPRLQTAVSKPLMRMDLQGHSLSSPVS